MSFSNNFLGSQQGNRATVWNGPGRSIYCEANVGYDVRNENVPASVVVVLIFLLTLIDFLRALLRVIFYVDASFLAVACGVSKIWTIFKTNHFPVTSPNLRSKLTPAVPGRFEHLATAQACSHCSNMTSLFLLEPPIPTTLRLLGARGPDWNFGLKIAKTTFSTLALLVVEAMAKSECSRNIWHN